MKFSAYQRTQIISQNVCTKRAPTSKAYEFLGSTSWPIVGIVRSLHFCLRESVKWFLGQASPRMALMTSDGDCRSYARCPPAAPLLRPVCPHPLSFSCQVSELRFTAPRALWYILDTNHCRLCFTNLSICGSSYRLFMNGSVIHI